MRSTDWQHIPRKQDTSNGRLSNGALQTINGNHRGVNGLYVMSSMIRPTLWNLEFIFLHITSDYIVQTWAQNQPDKAKTMERGNGQPNTGAGGHRIRDLDRTVVGVRIGRGLGVVFF